MQQIIQHIFKQIIDFYFYLSRIKPALGIKTNFFLSEYSFWPEIYKKYQKLSGHAFSQLLPFLTLNLCGY